MGRTIPNSLAAARRATRAADRRASRIRRDSHGGYAGKSILELIEDELLAVTWEYLHTPKDEENAQKRWVLRGRIRGIATCIGLLRYPYRRYTLKWWHFIKKQERNHSRMAHEYEEQPPRAQYLLPGESTSS